MALNRVRMKQGRRLDANMKTRTLPAVSDELVIPKPAPGENVYPIYSKGVICGYVYSGGNQKKPKIFLTEDQTSAEEKPPKTKSDDFEWRSCLMKTSEKTAAKSTARQPVNPPKPKKETKVSLSGKIPAPPNVSNIEPKALIPNHSDKIDVPCSSSTLPNGNTIDLGRKGSALGDNTSLPVFEVPTPAKKNVLQIRNPSNVSSLVAKQNSNPEPSIVMTSTPASSSLSSSITTFANRMAISTNPAQVANKAVILPRALTTNCSRPVILTSGNLALQSANWLTAPVQQNQANTVTYFIMPTGSLGQTQIYCTTSANTMSTVLPTVTTQSRTTMSTVDSSIVQPSSVTTPSTVIPPVNRTAVPAATPNNGCNQMLSTFPAATPKNNCNQMLSTFPAATPNNNCNQVLSTFPAATPNNNCNQVLSTFPAATPNNNCNQVLSTFPAATPNNNCNQVLSTFPAATPNNNCNQVLSTFPAATPNNNCNQVLSTFPAATPNNNCNQVLSTFPAATPNNNCNQVLSTFPAATPNNNCNQVLSTFPAATPNNNCNQVLSTFPAATPNNNCNQVLSTFPAATPNNNCNQVLSTFPAATPNNNCNQVLSTLPLKAIVPKSTYVQVPVQLSTSSVFNGKVKNVYGKGQPVGSQFKIFKLKNLENENGTSETEASLINSGTNGEKTGQESVSFGSDIQNIVADGPAIDGPAVESTKTDQEKTVDSSLSINSDQTNKSEASSAASSFISKENENLLLQGKRPRGRPKKSDKTNKTNKTNKIPVPILPATKNSLEIGSLITLSGNDPYVQSYLANKQLPKQQSGNPLSALPSRIFWVANGEKVSKDSPSCNSDAQSNEADGPVAAELTKDVQEITIDSDLDANSSKQTNKVKEVPSAAASLISKEEQSRKYQSLMKNTKSALAVPMKKRHKSRHRTALLVPRSDKPVASATGNNSEIEACQLNGFNLLPSGNYVLGSQNEVDDGDGLVGNQPTESKAHLSECETNKQSTCDKENKSTEREPKERSKSSSSEKEKEKERHCSSSKFVRVSIKTEPLDHDSGVNKKNCTNWSDNRTSSASSAAANVRPKLPCKEEKKSEDESTAIEDENQLVISSCFSLSSQTESDRKLISNDSVNSGFDNLFFLPNKTAPSHESLAAKSNSQGETSPKVAKEIKLKECSVRLEPLSYSLLSSSESSSEEEDSPCTKPAAENGKASPKGDASNIKTLDSSANVSALPPAGSKRSLESLAKSILNQGCLKKLKENLESVEKLDSSVNVSSIPKAETKKSHKAPGKSILDPEHLKKLKEHYESVDLLESSVNASALSSTGSKKSLEVPAKSVGQTLDNNVYLSSLISAGIKRSLDDSVKPIPGHLKKFKENHASVDKTEISIHSSENKELSSERSKTKSETVSQDVVLIPDSIIDNSSKPSDKSLGASQPIDDSLVVDLTEDNEGDAFIEGCIAFHEQQLYMLQLQMDQHKMALQKLKKEQIYRKGSK